MPYTAFELTNPYVDGYLFDYKTDEAEKYSRLGGDRHLIRDNIRALLRDGKNVRIRIPLIPNFNTSDAAIHSMCESLRELGVKTVDLIPFHRMGSGKYKALGLSYPYQDISLLAKEQLQKIRNTFSDYFETNLEI